MMRVSVLSLELVVSVLFVSVVMCFPQCTHRSDRVAGWRMAVFMFTYLLGLIAVMTQISVVCC